MCIPGLGALLGLGAGAGAAGAATAAGATAAAATGATAAAATGATALQTVGTLIAIGGSLYSGIAGMKAASDQAAAIADAKQTEAQLTAVKDQRTRAKFASAMRKQNAELATRGVDLNSPTAILLGQEAAREMSFESQAIRAGGEATQRELSAQERIARSNATTSLLRGVTGAAGTLIDYGPQVWPELLS